MADILHKIIIKASPDKVYEALTTKKGLSGWWTPMTEARPEVDSIAKFRFGNGTLGPDMQITELKPGRYVEWRCVDSIPEWVGTRLTFHIRPHDNGAELLFGHLDWKEPTEFYMHCNSKWGFFLGVSLKKYLEEGRGRPHPEDPDF